MPVSHYLIPKFMKGKRMAGSHKGFTAHGDVHSDNGHELVDVKTDELTGNEDLPLDDTESRKTACTILYGNGQYQRPNVTITGGKIWVRLGAQVEKIQMRHSPSGGIRFYKAGGPFTIPNGTYVLSLWGSTYGKEYIKACIDYT